MAIVHSLMPLKREITLGRGTRCAPLMHGQTNHKVNNVWTKLDIAASSHSPAALQHRMASTSTVPHHCLVPMIYSFTACNYSSTFLDLHLVTVLEVSFSAACWQSFYSCLYVWWCHCLLVQHGLQLGITVYSCHKYGWKCAHPRGWLTTVHQIPLKLAAQNLFPTARHVLPHEYYTECT